MSDEARVDQLQGKIVHEYDGIEEADNELPRWWLAIFYLTTAFGVGYWFYYEEFKVGPSPTEVYREDAAERLAEAAKRGASVSDESLRAEVKDATVLAKGAEVFATNCASCHTASGAGLIGPNLTDKRWIHGGAPKAIYKIIAEGVPSKGMPAWEPVLGAEAVHQATVFVLSLRNTNVPGKAPEGEEYSGD